MTDLKAMLDHAAGDEPAVTGDTLAADLGRGRRSARRRSVASVVAGATATAVVVGGGWTALTGAGRLGTAADPGVAASASPTPSAVVTAPGSATALPPAPAPDRPVELERDALPRAGTDLVCNLKPKGWRAVVRPGGAATSGALAYVHPTLHDLGTYRTVTTEITVLNTVFQGDSQHWLEIRNGIWRRGAGPRREGQRSAVVIPAHLRGSSARDGLGRYMVVQHASRTVAMENLATALGWDVQTAFRFLGSCHYRR